MDIFEAKPKNWGNSLGITIPKEIVKKNKLTPKKKIKVFVMGNEMEAVKKELGKLKINKSTQEIMNEIDEGYD